MESRNIKLSFLLPSLIKLQCLKKVIEAHSTVQQRFGVLTALESMPDDDILGAIERLVCAYASDLSSDFLKFFQFIYCTCRP